MAGKGKNIYRKQLLTSFGLFFAGATPVKKKKKKKEKVTIELQCIFHVKKGRMEKKRKEDR